MTTDLQVAHQSVKVAVADLDVLAGSLRRSDGFVHTYFSVEPGGRFLSDTSRLLDTIREHLGHQYLTLGDTVEAAADTVLEIWKDFERVDARARIEFEKKQQQGGLPPLTKPPPPIAPHPSPGPAAPTVDAARLDAHLVDPKANTSVLDALDDWQQIKSKVDQVLGFEFLVGPYQEFGLHVPLNVFRDYMEGRYLDWAEAAAGLFALGDYFREVQTQLDAGSEQVGAHWLGQTSTAVQQWLTRLGGASVMHGRALTSLGSSIQLQAETLKLLLDQLLDLLNDLADLMPVISSAAEGFLEGAAEVAKGLLKGFIRAVAAASRLIVKIFARIELVVDAVAVIGTILSMAPADLTFAPIPAPAAPPR